MAINLCLQDCPQAGWTVSGSGRKSHSQVILIDFLLGHWMQGEGSARLCGKGAMNEASLCGPLVLASARCCGRPRVTVACYKQSQLMKVPLEKIHREMALFADINTRPNHSRRHGILKVLGSKLNRI